MALTKSLRASAIVLCASLLAALATLHAQTTSAMDQAALAELAPGKRAEILSRATGKNAIGEVLETALLNNIKAPYPANRIIALDYGRSVAIVEVPDGQPRPIDFNKLPLVIS